MFPSPTEGWTLDDSSEGRKEEKDSEMVKDEWLRWIKSGWREKGSFVVQKKKRKIGRGGMGEIKKKVVPAFSDASWNAEEGMQAILGSYTEICPYSPCL